MKTKVLVGILLFLIVVNLSTIGVFVVHMLRGPKEAELMSPEGGRPAGMMAPETPMMRLQPEVRERMHKLMMTFREDTRDLQQKIFVLEDTTVALLKNDPPPMGHITDNLKQISDLRLLINQKAIHNLLQAKSFLPPEQQDMFFRAIMQARPQIGRYGAGMMGRGSMWGRQTPGRSDSSGPYQTYKGETR
jgi:Spy/CpxP family protein refolding chaperone